MRVAHGARAPWYSLHNYYRVGSSEERRKRRRRRRRRMGVEREGISYLFLTGIQDGESRPKDFCVTCRPLPCARHSREMNLLSSPRRGEESIRGGSRAAWYAETRPWRAYGRVKGCGISPPLPIGTPFFQARRIFASRITPCVELIMKFLKADSPLEIWDFEDPRIQDGFETARGKFGDLCKAMQISRTLILIM